MSNKRELLIDAMDEVSEYITDNRNTRDEIKIELRKYGITGGRIERIFGNLTELESEETDIRELILIAEQFFMKTSFQKLNPTNWFTEDEMKEARQYYATEPASATAFPFILERVGIAKNNVYSAMVSASTIAEWLKIDALYYNFDIQRQATKKTRKKEVIATPTVVQKNVNEIESLMLSGELVVTTLAFNAAPQTSDLDEELTYDAKKGILTINTGTRLDILDGFHRCLGSLAAVRKNPNVDFKFNVLISNYTTREAQMYQAQLQKATPIPKARVQELEANRHADAVVTQLKANSELRGKVSSSHTISPAQGELVSYRVLADAIDREFKMSARVHTFGVSKYLSEFFDYLIGMNEEEFSYNKDKDVSLMNSNRMFAGYVALASKMKDANIEPQMVNKILEQVDFNKENPLWRDMDLLDDNLNMSAKASDRKIADYFRKLKV